MFTLQGNTELCMHVSRHCHYNTGPVFYELLEVNMWPQTFMGMIHYLSFETRYFKVSYRPVGHPRTLHFYHGKMYPYTGKLSYKSGLRWKKCFYFAQKCWLYAIINHYNAYRIDHKPHTKSPKKSENCKNRSNKFLCTRHNLT